MPFRIYLLLFLFGIIPPVIIAQFQPAPGYLDSDYYFAGGIQLATGRGFNEPYLWNYLDGTTSLPHPSHSYWMPLASIVSAAGMLLTGQITYSSGRLFFFFIAALVPPITAALAFTFSRKRENAILSAVFSIFSVYHASFVGVTDNFGIYMVLGGLYFLVATKILAGPPRGRYWFLLGWLAGWMTLSRTDGLLWLILTFLFAFWRFEGRYQLGALKIPALNSLLALFGFLVIMSPWYVRNLNIYGAVMAPGGSRVLWLDNYDQTFIYPPSLLSADYFLSLGWKEILADRLGALKLNLQSGFAAHGGIILFPFIVAGFISNKNDLRVKLAGTAWLALFIVMTLVFPFAGARGAFFHAGAALQPIWWSLAPLGLDAVLVFLRNRGWGNDQTRLIFRSALVMITVILTVFVVQLRLFSIGWGEGEDNYPKVEQFLVGKGISDHDIVIVRNAPGYYLETGRSAISIPYGGEQAILDVSRQFGADYLIVESEAALKQILSLYQSPQNHDHFDYLGEVDEIRIFKITFE